MNQSYRLKEYSILFYRLILVYFFYFIARLLFFIFNKDLLNIDFISEFFKISYHGLAFDTTAILYINSLFILLSILPLIINTKAVFQKILFYIYFTTNLIAYATNFVDIIYYKFSNFRLTTTVLNEFEGETNGLALFFSFLRDYGYIFLLFIIIAWLWIYLYKKANLNPLKINNKKIYFGFSLITFLVSVTLIIGGIRGDFKKSTRPINLVDANKYVKNPIHAALVLNTPFALIRTINKNKFKKSNYFSEKELLNIVKPIKQYNKTVDSKPNIIVLIVESYAREYLGAFNKRYNIPNYKSYTPFLDSLAQHSLIFDNAFANGRKSIHGMSSILAGIPSFKVAFTSSSYVNQKIQSLVSCLNDYGYNTSFFHGAANGSMGFLGFGNILGLDHYYGKTEFNNNDQSGIWGIWDEPFLQYTIKILNTKQEPFFTTVFTISSHDPFVLPKKYKGKFPKGDLKIHKVVGYTDYALKKFFENAKKQPWFKNTIFVVTADHTNQKFYPKYKKGINRSAIPILFYKPDNSLTKLDSTLAQQIDIYPTLLDMVGYKKPFRSWGRSLINSNSEPFVITHTGNVFHFMKGNYTCVFDGKKAIGFYKIEDDALKNNLIKSKDDEMQTIENECKAYIEDYYNRIVDKRL
ncbi:MAG: LTA synthase family protein [Flavobacteriaceae bacterium]|nr:LTA synthase family protein [Flavobacteriaceae bacterium]